MTLTERVKAFLKDNAWVLIAVFFFIAWKFFLISTLWEDRIIPPVPDDSYVYILHLDGTINCPNLFSCADRAINFSTYAGFDHLTYRILIGVPAKIIGLNPVEAYEFGFYLGTAGLLFALLFFLRSLALGIQSKGFFAFSLFILALYNGAGSFHGFYWVVPSYFAFISFIVTLSLFLRADQKCWQGWLALSVPLGIFSHILALYLLAILPFIAFFKFVYERTFPLLLIKKNVFIFFIAALTYIPVAYHYSKISHGNPYGPEKAVSSVISPHFDTSHEINHARIGSPSLDSTFTFEGLFPGWNKINENYLRWIFPSWIGYIIFISCIGILFYFQQYRILGVYFSAFLFTLIASVNIHGERSLIFLWPITYLLYGQSAWFGWKIFAKASLPSWLRIIGRTLIFLITLFFILLSLSYSYLWNQYLNGARNINISPQVMEYLHKNLSPQEKIAYSEEMSLLGNMLYIDFGANRPQHTALHNEAKYYIALTKEKKIQDEITYNSLFHTFFQVISKTLLFTRHLERKSTDVTLPEVEDIHFQKVVTFGDVEIYRIEKK